MHFPISAIAAMAVILSAAEAVPRNVHVAGRADLGAYGAHSVQARAASGNFARRSYARLNVRADDDKKDKDDDKKSGDDDKKGGDDDKKSGDDDKKDGDAKSTKTAKGDEKPTKTSAASEETATGGGSDASAPSDDGASPTATGDGASASATDAADSAPAESGSPSESSGASAPISSGSASGGSSSSGNSTSAGTGTMPASAGQSTLSAPMKVTGVFDGGMKTFDRGVKCTGQSEGGDSDAVFDIQEGGTLKNVIIGADQKEGVHCQGSCTLENVWWEAVCEDAFTIKKQTASGTTTITGGGAKGAEDKVLQHNGGGTLKVSGFTVDNFGKLYRSCGNCKESAERHIILDGVKASGGTSTLSKSSSR